MQLNYLNKILTSKKSQKKSIKKVRLVSREEKRKTPIKNKILNYLEKSPFQKCLVGLRGSIISP